MSGKQSTSFKLDKALKAINKTLKKLDKALEVILRIVMSAFVFWFLFNFFKGGQYIEKVLFLSTFFFICIILYLIVLLKNPIFLVKTIEKTGLIKNIEGLITFKKKYE